MDLESIFINVNPVTLAAVSLGGGSLGIYFAVLNRFKKADKVISGIVSFIVIGWSFYLPFAFASSATNEGADPTRFVGSMVLWVVFAVATTAAYQGISYAAGNFRRDRRGE